MLLSLRARITEPATQDDDASAFLKTASVKPGLGPRASQPRSSPTQPLTFCSVTVGFYPPEQRPAFDVAFVPCEGGRAHSFKTDFIFLQITNNKPLGAPFANKGALFFFPVHI